MKRRFINIFATVVLFAGLTAACADSTPETTIRTEEKPGEPAIANTNAAPAADTDGLVSLGTITGNLSGYIGKTVTVQADVQEVLGPNAFTLDEDDLLTGGIDRDVLVLSPQAGRLEKVEDNWLRNKVRVTGTVRGVALVEIERELGWDLDPKIEAEFEEVKAVIIASSLERVPSANF